MTQPPPDLDAWLRFASDTSDSSSGNPPPPPRRPRPTPMSEPWLFDDEPQPRHFGATAAVFLIGLSSLVAIVAAAIYVVWFFNTLMRAL